jgi:hypothetical protein
MPLTPALTSQGAALEAHRSRISWRALFATFDHQPRSAIDRLALAILRASGEPTDIRSVAVWACCVGTNRTSLVELCRRNRLKPRNVRDFMRAMRALRVAEGESRRFDVLLDVGDLRTLRKIRVRTGLAPVCDGEVLSLEAFLTDQTFLPSDHPVLAALVNMRHDMRPCGIPSR